MRRISFELHGVADSTYTNDAFNDPGVLDDTFAIDNLTHLVRLVAEIETASDLELQLNYPELLNGSSVMSVVDCIAMHRRWSAEAAEVLFANPVPQMVR